MMINNNMLTSNTPWGDEDLDLKSWENPRGFLRLHFNATFDATVKERDLPADGWVRKRRIVRIREGHRGSTGRWLVEDAVNAVKQKVGPSFAQSRFFNGCASDSQSQILSAEKDRGK